MKKANVKTEFYREATLAAMRWILVQLPPKIASLDSFFGYILKNNPNVLLMHQAKKRRYDRLAQICSQFQEGQFENKNAKNIVHQARLIFPDRIKIETGLYETKLRQKGVIKIAEDNIRIKLLSVESKRLIILKIIAPSRLFIIRPEFRNKYSNAGTQETLIMSFSLAKEEGKKNLEWQNRIEIGDYVITILPFFNKWQEKRLDEKGYLCVVRIKYPQEYSSPPSLDRLIARACIWFFQRKRIYFSCVFDKVYQEIYTALAKTKRDKKALSKDELKEIGLKAVSRFVLDEVYEKYREILSKRELKDSLRVPEEYIFGDRLKVRRLYIGLGVKELAKMVEVRRDVVLDWERGEFLPKPKHMKRLAIALNTTVSELLVGIPKEELMNIRLEDEDGPRYRKLFALKIKVLRYETGLLPRELAKKIEVPWERILDWERKEALPKAPKRIKDLAEALNTTISQLLAGVHEEKLLNMHTEDKHSPEGKKLFGLKVKILRRKAGLGQKELGEKIGAAGNVIPFWELGKCLPRPKYMRRIAEVLGTTEEKLIGEKK